jgi:hypothetical protein
MAVRPTRRTVWIQRWSSLPPRRIGLRLRGRVRAERHVGERHGRLDFQTPDGLRSLNASVYPAGDDDWYRLTANLARGPNCGPPSFPVTPCFIDLYYARMDVYRDGVQVAADVRAYKPDDAFHLWEIRVDSRGIAAYELYFNSWFDNTGAPLTAPRTVREPRPPSRCRTHTGAVGSEGRQDHEGRQSSPQSSQRS